MLSLQRENRFLSFPPLRGEIGNKGGDALLGDRNLRGELCYNQKKIELAD